MKHVEAVISAEEHLTGRRTPVEGTPVEFEALDAPLRAVVVESTSLGVEAGEAVVGAEPEHPFVIFEDAVDDVVRQALFFGVMGEGAGVGIEATEAAAIGRNPQDARIDSCRPAPNRPPSYR